MSMRIFIDESGPFARNPQGAPSPSVVTALIVSEGSWARIESKYAKLRRSLPLEKGEVKGRLLAEPQVCAVAEILRRNGGIVETVVIDPSLHSEAEFQAYRASMADNIRIRPTSDPTEEIVALVEGFRAELREMTEPQFLQALATFRLVARAVPNAITYFAQRAPRELARFDWTIDAKDRLGETNWEKWWRQIIIPWLQWFSHFEPITYIEGVDYSHLERFRSPTPAHILASEPDIGATSIEIPKLLTEHFRFSSSADPGLELVDVVANATRRALVGNLGEEGWMEVARMMIRRPDGSLSCITIAPPTRSADTLPWGEVVRRFQSTGRDILSPSVRRSL